MQVIAIQVVADEHDARAPRPEPRPLEVGVPATVGDLDDVAMPAAGEGDDALHPQQIRASCDELVLKPGLQRLEVDVAVELERDGVGHGLRAVVVPLVDRRDRARL